MQRLDVVDQLHRSYFRSRMVSGSSSGKRKRVVLSIDVKVDIIGMIDRGSSLTAIAEKFGIAKSTVSDIKKSKDKILAFKSDMAGMGMSRKAK